MIEMIKAPFKRKSAPNVVVADANGGAASGTSLSPKGTPNSMRGCSVTRSLSLGSSVNSLLELQASCDSTNIYAEIDVNRVLLLLCEQKNNQTLTLLNAEKDMPKADKQEDTGAEEDEDGVVVIRRNDENGSKNNLLEYDGGSNSTTGATAAVVGTHQSEYDDMWSSVNVHLDNIDKVNKSLDEKLMNSLRPIMAAAELPSTSVDVEHRTSLREMFKNTFSRDETAIERERLIDDDSDRPSTTTTSNPSDKPIDVFNDSALDSIAADSEELRRKKEKKKMPKKSDAVKKTARSFKANKSVNALLTSFKDFKNSKRKIDQEVFEHVEAVQQDAAHHKDQHHEDVNLLPSHSKSSAMIMSNKINLIKPKKQSKLKKLKLQLKLSSTSSAAAAAAANKGQPAVCRHCFKQRKPAAIIEKEILMRNEMSPTTPPPPPPPPPLLPSSPTSESSPVLESTAQEIVDEFCACHASNDDDDDGLCINEHTYSELDGVSTTLIRPPDKI